MTHHLSLHKPTGFPWWQKPLLWQQWRHILSKNCGQAIFTPSTFLCHRFSIVIWLSIKLFTNPFACHGSTSRRLATKTLYFDQKLWPRNFHLVFPLVSPFQHCHMNQLQTLYKRNGLQWWHNPSLYQQWQNILSENHIQANLTPYSWLCHRFKTVTWISIELMTNPLRCDSGTSCCYGKNDIIKT